MTDVLELECESCGHTLGMHGINHHCGMFLEKQTPLSTEWLKSAGFCEPTRSSIDGYSYWFKYINGYHAVAVRFEKRNSKWQWQLEEHRDHMNWDDKYLSLPGSCQPQTTRQAENLIAVLGGRI